MVDNHVQGRLKVVPNQMYRNFALVPTFFFWVMGKPVSIARTIPAWDRVPASSDAVPKSVQDRKSVDQRPVPRSLGMKWLVTVTSNDRIRVTDLEGSNSR